MPRKNIFKYEKLLLDYNENHHFILRKWNKENKDYNPSGSLYSQKRAKDLIETIKYELDKNNKEKQEDFKLKTFELTKEAQKQLGLEAKVL